VFLNLVPPPFLEKAVTTGPPRRSTLPIIMGRVETPLQTNKDKELHLPKNPFRLHMTSIIRLWLRRCTWCTTSTGMSRLPPASTTSGEDSKQLPTNSCRFGCPIKPWAVTPSSRMEWMRSCCHTNSSRPRLRSGRSRVSICNLPLLGQVLPSHVCYFMDSFPTVCYPCMRAFLHPEGCVIELFFMCSVHPWQICLASACLFHHNSCPRTYLFLLYPVIPNLLMPEVL